MEVKMYKIMQIIICSFLLIINNVYAQESPHNELFSINGINFNEFDFIEKNLIFRGLAHRNVIIHGWSRDGVIFYSVCEGLVLLNYIKNLVDDKIIWYGYNYNFPNNNASKDLISRITRRFNIEPYIGEIGEFPFRLNDNLYECFGANQRNSEPGVSSYLIDIIIRKNGEQNNIKKINSILAYDSWGDNNDIMNNLKCWYIKSPFENRIAVVVFIPQAHGEFEYRFYDVDILGCHLGTGFN
jgi:hypothetical protein